MAFGNLQTIDLTTVDENYHKITPNKSKRTNATHNGNANEAEIIDLAGAVSLFIRDSA